MESRYIEEAAGAALEPWVECAWAVAVGEPLSSYAVRPDGCADIVYSRRGGLRAVGPMTVEQRFEMAAGEETVGVRFQPGMAGGFLKAAPGELTDRIVPLEALWGRRGRELEDRLNVAKSLHECLRLLRGAIPAPPERPHTVHRAIAAINAANGDVDLDAVVAQTNLSSRHFRRRCLEESGLTPKHLCRVLRFRHACRLAAAGGSPEWSAIALDAGYFDQAHMIRDFREFTGGTPMSVFSNTRGGVTASIAT